MNVKRQCILANFLCWGCSANNRCDVWYWCLDSALLKNLIKSKKREKMQYWWAKSFIFLTNLLNRQWWFAVQIPKNIAYSCKMDICSVQLQRCSSRSLSSYLDLPHLPFSLLSVSSYYPNPSPAMTLHHYLPLIFPLLPSSSLFAQPFLLSLTCIYLPLLFLMLPCFPLYWFRVFPLGGLTSQHDFINVNQSAW